MHIITFQALKDGDTDAEARFSYPKMYAEGFSEHATSFNCVQRGHQQALESYPMFLALSLVGGIQYPLTCAAGGALWNYARFKWAEGYATGDPSQRYSHWASKGVRSDTHIHTHTYTHTHIHTHTHTHTYTHLIATNTLCTETS